MTNHQVFQGRKGKGGKGGGGDSGKESPNTLRSKAMLKLTDMWGEGEIVGLVNGAQSIFFDQTPLQSVDGGYNFQGVTWAQRVGLPDQPVVPGQAGVEAETTVGTQVKYGNPITRSLTDPTFTACVVTVRFPALTKADDKGNINGSSVQFQIDIRYQGGSWVTSTGATTVTGKCTSPFDKQYYFVLPKNPSGDSAPWDIRITRITQDSNSLKTQNDLYFAAFKGIIEHTFTYPNTAYIGMAIDAEDFGSNLPARSYELYGRKVSVPSNYTTRTYNAAGTITRNPVYTGLWDGTFVQAWTNNPAWIFYDLITNDRFGLGDVIDQTQVDKWSLYEIAQYCDAYVPNGFGGLEPRFTFNGYIMDRTEAFDALSNIASCFRGMAYWSSGAIIATQDSPKDPVMLVTPSNVISGAFDRQSSALKSRHTVAMVKWNNPDNFYKEEIEVVQNDAGIAKYGYRETQITATGCTSRGQAHRMGLWTLLTELNAVGTISYQAGLDHAGIRPGDIIAIQDPAQADVDFGGRLSSVGGTTTTPSVQLLTNFDFSQPLTTGWQVSTSPASTGTLCQIVSGQLQMNGNGTNSIFLDQSFPTIVGQTYTITLDLKNASSGTLQAGTTKGAGDLLAQYTPSGTGTPRTETKTFVATTTTSWVRLTKTGTAIWTVDNFKVTGPQAVTSITAMNLDHEVILDATHSYTISVQLPDGSIGEQTITAQLYGVPVTQVVLAAPFPSTPDPEAMWVITRNDLVPELFRVVSIKESAPHIYDVMALQHEPSIYDAVDLGKTFEPIQTSQWPTGPIPKPTNVTVKEYAYVSDQAGTKVAVDISATLPQDARVQQFQWQYRQTDDPDVGVQEFTSAGVTVEPIVTVVDLGKGMFDFRVRSVSQLGGYSAWVTVTGVHLLGTDLPPATPDTFKISVLGQLATLSWTVPALLNVAGYELRHTPKLTGATWTSASVLLEGISGTSVQVPALPGTYLIKSVSYSGAYSTDAEVIVNEIDGGALLNAVATLTEDPLFTGTKTNVTLTSGHLRLTPDGSGNFPTTGTYVFANSLDLGAVYTSRITATLNVFGVDTRNTLSTWTNLASVAALSTVSSDLWDARVQYRTTNDDPAGTPTWSAWSNLTTGDIKFRAVQFQVIFTSNNPKVTPEIDNLQVTIDMPDRIISGKDISVPTAGLTVSFSPPYKALTGVSIAAQDMATGDRYAITTKSATGFKIQFFNSAGTAISRTFDYNAVGYGVVLS